MNFHQTSRHNLNPSTQLPNTNAHQPATLYGSPLLHSRSHSLTRYRRALSPFIKINVGISPPQTYAPEIYRKKRRMVSRACARQPSLRSDMLLPHLSCIFKTEHCTAGARVPAASSHCDTISEGKVFFFFFWKLTIVQKVQVTIIT